MRNSDADRGEGGAELRGRGMTEKPPVLKSPFPYPGGKSKVADLVWSRLGNVDNYVEPFAGSLAVLLRRPADHFEDGYCVETCNDVNHYLVNFWRSVKADPDRVAEFAGNPVLEADLHARHKWLVRSAEAVAWRKRMAEDPEAYDAKIAGWWVWGACCWIGSGWCDRHQIQRLSSKSGVNGCEDVLGRPQLTDAFDIGRGVNASAHVKRPRFQDGGLGCGVNGSIGMENTCDARRAWLTDWMRRLSDRLRLVRTCYGHWSRICDSDSTLTRLGTTGVFLDPPYPPKRADGSKSRDDGLYANDKTQDLNVLRDECLAWCRKWGQDKLIRVAVCGYEGDGYEALEQDGWSVQAWEANGGYGNQRKGKKRKAENAARERIWFSPACVKPLIEPTLFDEVE